MLFKAYLYLLSLQHPVARSFTFNFAMEVCEESSFFWLAFSLLPNNFAGTFPVLVLQEAAKRPLYSSAEGSQASSFVYRR